MVTRPSPADRCASHADACQPATHDLRRFHGGCHHGPDGWQRLSQNYMRTTCFTHRGYFGMPRNDDCHVQRSTRREMQQGRCA